MFSDMRREDEDFELNDSKHSLNIIYSCTQKTNTKHEWTRYHILCK
jgi:hypothetical protein